MAVAMKWHDRCIYATLLLTTGWPSVTFVNSGIYSVSSHYKVMGLAATIRHCC